MKIYLQWIFGFGMISALGACVTSGTGSDHNPYDRSQIVHQTSGRNVVTHLDRDFWIETRQTSNNEHMKLYSGLGMKEWDVAINDARLYLRDHPNDRVALTVLATALAMKQNYSLAAYYGRLLERHYPNYPETSNLLGLATLNRPGASYRDFQEAAAYFEKAFDSHGNQIASGLNLGHLHLEMANASAAKDVFRIVSRRCNQCNEALIGYGIASSQRGDYDDAEAAFQQILKRNPDNAEAQYYLAIIATYGRNDDRRAMRLLSNLLKSPNDDNLEIKRKGNFLLRRLEAKHHASKPRGPREELSETMIQALDSD